MSIRNKIVILFTTLTAAITILLGVLIYFFTEKHLERDFFQTMMARAGIAGHARFRATEKNIHFYNEIREKHLQRLPQEKEYFFDSFPSSKIAASLHLNLPDDFYAQLASSGSVSFKNKDTSFIAILYEHEHLRHMIIVSALNVQGSKLLYDLKKNLFFGILTAIIIVYIISRLLLSKAIVNPISHIIKNVQKITASNLHLRLQPKSGKDELVALTQTFNDMLDRLETSFETQSNFLNKAAHELRTPLTAIMGETELALSRQCSTEEYITALQVIFREAEQLEHHTSSLLELAQAGNNSKENFMTEVRLDELLFSVKRLINFTEPGNQVQIDLNDLATTESWITITGNTNLLKLALSNIIQNACKYSNLKDVHVSLHTNATHCIIRIIDKGIGIPENELKYIFDPFFRASNTTNFKGYGVGLPLAQKIIRLHRGELYYSSKENEGTTVTVLFPLLNR